MGTLRVRVRMMHDGIACGALGAQRHMAPGSSEEQELACRERSWLPSMVLFRFLYERLQFFFSFFVLREGNTCKNQYRRKRMD